MTVSRIERGEREASNSIAIAYQQVSGGKVRAVDLQRVRRRFVRSKGQPAKAA